MGKFVMRNAFISVNGTNISDHCSAVTVEDKTDTVELTSFGPSGYKEYAQGFHDATITSTIFSDFAGPLAIHGLLYPIYQSGGTCYVQVRADAGTVSATNPEARLFARMYSYTGLGGKVGDAADMDVTFSNGSTAGLTWGTT